jgi:hypothetical protein
MADPSVFYAVKNPDASLLIRTDFSDDSSWNTLCSKVSEAEPENGFMALFEYISDRQFEHMTADAIAALAHQHLDVSVIFIADRFAIEGAENAVLCVDAVSNPSAQFRVAAKVIWGPENNLRLANMDFADFVKSVDADGIFRGF